MKPLTLNEIHENTLIVLKRIIDICAEIDINYYLFWGSLLGAVRHHGFIPWDDDLDIAMLRPDYEKFKKYCLDNENKLKPFKLCCRENDPDYPFTIGRFSDTRFKMVTEFSETTDTGLFIDIYPLDGIGNDPQRAKRHKKLRNFVLRMVFYCEERTVRRSRQGFIGTSVNALAFLGGHLVGKKRLLDYFEKQRWKYSLDESNYVACVVWDNIHPMKKTWFTSPDTLLFEGIKVTVPSSYDALLRNVYGDYMELPPVELREPHHHYSLYPKETT